MPPGVFVVVSGPPASGKTTLAGAIAAVLGLPLIAKDTIKQALMTVLPVPDVTASRVVGHVLDGLPAVPLEVARGNAPVLIEHAGQRVGRQPDDEIDVGGGNGIGA